MTEPEWAPELFRRIACPRLAGTAALADVQAAIAARLHALGYQVERQTFSASPHRLTAVSALGAGLGWVGLLAAPLLVLPLPDWPVTVLGLAALALVLLLTIGIATRRLRVDAPVAQGINLVARRGRPRCWLVAHADSKSQAVSLLARVVAALCAGVGLLLLTVVLTVRASGPVPLWAAGAACGLALAGGGVLSFSRAGDASPGAVDNATGVIAALVAAACTSDREAVGILITDAEEFGLEGARAWASRGAVGGWFVNFDGLDDRGAYRVMRHVPRRATDADVRAARELSAGLASALGEHGVAVVEGPLPPGVLVDGLALAQRGMWGATVSRGDATTLSVVHTPRDSADRVSLASAVAAGRAAAEVLQRVLDA